MANRPKSSFRIPQPDLDMLRRIVAVLTDELFAWVSDGPSRTIGLVVAVAQLFEDQLPSGSA